MMRESMLKFEHFIQIYPEGEYLYRVLTGYFIMISLLYAERVFSLYITNAR